MNNKLMTRSLLSLTLTAALVGCSDSTEPTATDAPQSQADSHEHSADDGHDHGSHGHDHDNDDATQATPDIYTDLLGQIVQLPIAGDANTELKIQHEQIPDFKTKDGLVNVNAAGISGMPSMTMPFPLSGDANTDGLKIGDKVMFTFQVNWGGTGGPAWAITKLVKIDDDTPIDFNNFIGDLEEDATEAINDAMNDAMNNDAP